MTNTPPPAFTKSSTPFHFRSFNLADIANTPTGFIAVGALGSILRRGASGWTEENVSTGYYELSGVWQSDPGLTVAVGRYSPDGVQWRQAILMNTGAGWVDAGTPGAAPRLFDVWGSASDDIFAVGWGGEILHYDGSAWTPTSGGVNNLAFLHAVTGISSSSVIAVGRTNDLHGFAMTYDGSGWRSFNIAGAEELYGCMPRTRPMRSP